MSMDWKPVEQYVADDYLRKERGYGLREQTLYWVDQKTGKKTPMDSELKTELKKEFPNFGFLYELAEKLFNTLPCEDAEKRKYFESIEEALNDVINNVTTKQPLEFDNGFTKTIQKWFLGELARNFYYREENDQMLYDYLMSYYPIE